MHLRSSFFFLGLQSYLWFLWQSEQRNESVCAGEGQNQHGSNCNHSHEAVSYTHLDVYKRQGGDRGEREALSGCYRRSLEEAEKYGCKTVAFPAISTGVYGYPKEEAAKTALQAIRAYFAAHNKSCIEEVLLVAFDAANEELYRSLLKV